MSDFLAVLGAGVAIIVAALLLSGTSFFAAEEAGTLNKTLLSEESVGDVGAVEETFRHVPLGTFTVGQTLGEETAKEVPEMKIENGWFRQHSEAVAFPGEGAVSAYITFTVEAMNKYGRLQLLLNNRPIFDNVTKPGNYRIEIVQPAADNMLSIRAESSGPKFWAPTTYIIKDLKVVVKRYGSQEMAIPFTVYDYEATGWERGRISFGIDDAILSGDLVITANNNEVYRDRPISRSLLYQKDFSREAAQIKVGENTLRIKAEKGGKYSISNADMIIFFFAGGQTVSKTLHFKANASDVDAIESKNATGIITFDAKDVFLDNGITLSLNDKPIELGTVGAGENSVTFGAGYLRSGKNTLKLSTRGSYRIGRLDVEILRPEKQN